MLVAAAVVLAVTALGGIAAAAARARGANPPMPLALVHGAAGATGLVLLVLAGVTDEFTGALTTGLVLLVVAALGGFVLFVTHLRQRLIPLPIVVVHALVAVAGFVSVLVALAE